MTPKEKAEELFTHYYNMIQSIGGELGQEILVTILAKQSALFAVDELIKIHYLLTTTQDTSPSIIYWKEVKQELDNL